VLADKCLQYLLGLVIGLPVALWANGYELKKKGQAADAKTTVPVAPPHRFSTAG
jgi:hypothetical protein